MIGQGSPVAPENEIASDPRRMELVHQSDPARQRFTIPSR
jgi:hypothetical protein